MSRFHELRDTQSVGNNDMLRITSSGRIPRRVMKTGQSHENEYANVVIVCAPAILSKMMGSLHPAGALYEKPVNIRLAKEAHQHLVAVLERRGVIVRDVRDILLERVNWSVGDRVCLENLAFKCLSYVFKEDSSAPANGSETDSSGEKKTINEASSYYVSDQYKQAVIEEMGKQQLVDIILTNPTVVISPSQRDTGFTATYQFEPLSNIIFVRDQQITTRKGIVMARLRSQQRQREVDIMEFCFRKLGLDVIGRIPHPGHLEGGDFFPLGEKLCLIGIGPRSDWAAVEYLMERDLLGTDTVAVVKDEFEQKQERMHLDTVFNILGDDCCIMLEEMMGADSRTKRVVDEYIVCQSADSESGSDSSKRIGRYILRRQDVEFSSFMRENGFTIIPVTDEEQLSYGCNILNLGNGDVISIERNTARRIACSKAFKGTIEYLDFTAVTCMYGGVHCATQVVSRERGSGRNGRLQQTTKNANRSNNRTIDVYGGADSGDSEKEMSS
ncbi:Arginine deiminase [Gracilariopsis chorda]|uniref:Arginine deiminase n=1 Tax=Gracilariopsis chorda TaxID=448386 RepID=A0A2V3IM01_9FLOR|nr:Arginine deiminase [Gracilariopsis chorda]|eukprot:PXF43088.1 Arginine deiminase [Gracilariopsis chorda]